MYNVAMIIDILPPDRQPENYWEAPGPWTKETIRFECADCHHIWDSVTDETGLMNSHCPKGCHAATYIISAYLPLDEPKPPGPVCPVDGSPDVDVVDGKVICFWCELANSMADNFKSNWRL